MGIGAGVIDENVDTAKYFDGASDQVIDGSLVTGVRGQREGFASGCPDLLGDQLQAWLFAAAQDHLCPLRA